MTDELLFVYATQKRIMAAMKWIGWQHLIIVAEAIHFTEVKFDKVTTIVTAQQDECKCDKERR